MDYEAALRLAYAFGGGMGSMGEVCGAVTGAFMLISLKHGASDADDERSKEKTDALVAKFADEFKARNRTIICRHLLGFTIGEKHAVPGSKRIISERCPGYVRDSAGILEEILSL